MNTKDISAVSVICAACKHPNASEEKYCSSCGHALYEPCGNCVQPVLLGQSFCGGCGADLERIVADRQRKYDEHLSNAVTAAKQLDFETSLGLLNLVAEVQDFRFRISAETARKAYKRVSELRDRTISASDEKIARAITHYEAGELSDVVRLLKDVPKKLMNEDTRRIYSQSASSLDQLKSLEQEFAEASRGQDWVLAGCLVQQLQEALPDDRVYQKASVKIAAKLFAQAESLFAAKKHAAAARRLEAIPDKSQTPESGRLSETIQAVRWLESKLQSEAFASPTLGRLALRLSKLVPDDPRALIVAKEIAKTLRENNRCARSHFPKWRGDHDAWTGGQFQPFTRPTKIEFDEKNEIFRGKLGRFNVAIGLAIQGLGKARVTDDYSGRKKKLNLFGRKQVQPCWGIDLGSHSVKAVRMELTGEKLILTDFFYQEISDNIQQVVSHWKDVCDLESCSIWANLPASDVTTRFVRLPPVDDKKVTGLIEQEIQNRIPIPAKDLVVAKSLGQYDKDCCYGRPLIFSAARKSAIEKRLEIFEEAELKIDGLQSDCNAIVNLMAWEFADQLSSESTENPEAGESLPSQEKTPTIAWVDAGATTTTLLYVSGETHWFWSVENGGDKLTRALARSAKTTHREGEMLKAQPEKLKQPSQQFSTIETRMDELRLRFQKVAEDAMKQNSRFDVTETYVSGGSALTIGWMRRVVGQTHSITSDE